MPSRGLHIYATKTDLIDLIGPIEEQVELRYTEEGHFDRRAPRVC